MRSLDVRTLAVDLGSVHIKMTVANSSSFIMAVFLLSISLGNQFTAAVNYFIQNPDGTTKLEGASYYWFFVIVMFVTSLVFMIVVKFYREQTHIQGGQPNTEPAFEAVLPAEDDHA